MPIGPVPSSGQNLIRAYLEILVPKVADPIIPLRFNPTEYQIQKANTFAEIGIPGLESPPIQFIRGGGEKLTLDLLVDTSDTLVDVREAYIKRIRSLLNVDGELHAPPIVRLTWSTQEFKGVIESLNITYTLFTPQGVPLRAKLNVTMKEYRPVAVQLRENPRHSPDVAKSYTVRRGDTLTRIAAAVYRNPNVWRDIARHNEIRDPRRLPPGQMLVLPRLR